MEFEIRRRRMVERLRERGIRDVRVLAAFAHVPRHRFVDPALWSRAYSDQPLPIGFGQTISQPWIVARMVELAELEPEHRVLELGTGSGFQTAVLAELTREVCTVERVAWLADRARAALAELPYDRVHFHVGDGTEGWAERAPYDRILVTAGAPAVPRPLVDQLAPDGILVIPVGDAGGQRLLRVRRDEGGEPVSEEVEDVAFVKLLGRHGWAI